MIKLSSCPIKTNNLFRAIKFCYRLHYEQYAVRCTFSDRKIGRLGIEKERFVVRIRIYLIERHKMNSLSSVLT